MNYNITMAATRLWLTPFGEINVDGHLVAEVVLVLMVLYLLLLKQSKPKKEAGKADLTEDEVDELCAEWRPEPLVPVQQEDSMPKERVITSSVGSFVIADGRKVLNLVSTNFLGFAGDRTINAACKKTLLKYGCGSAGPRGFYGTIDVHLELEERLAKFLNVGEAILYSYGVATMTSLIPAYAKRGDHVVCDEGINYALQSGCILSRSKLKYFKHNDVADLEKVLDGIRGEDEKRKDKKLNRRFVLVEGIYSNYGDIAPLEKIVALCRKYCFRLIVDESMSMGVLGKSGRGCFEHYNIEQSPVDIITGSMCNAFGSVGGFCAGEKEMIAHQRLNGNGYVFSASLPPFLATASIKALDLMEEKGAALAEKLQSNAFFMRKGLRALGAFNVEGQEVSPLIHLRLKDASVARVDAQKCLQSFVDHVFEHSGVMMTTSKYSPLDTNAPPPSIRIAVTALHSEAELTSALKAIKKGAHAFKLT